MTIFTLLHGGAHTPWYWNLVRTELERHGHRVVTPSIPMEDQSATLTDWTRIALQHAREEIGESTSEIVVVGHSSAGMITPQVAQGLNAARIVLLSAQIALPGVSWNDYVKENTDAIDLPWDRMRYDEQGRLVQDWDFVRDIYYHDVDEALAREANSHLLPIASKPFDEPNPLTEWPAIPVTYILCQGDRSVVPGWSRRVSLQMFGAPPIELPGSHSPMLSRPELLARTLMELEID